MKKTGKGGKEKYVTTGEGRENEGTTMYARLQKRERGGKREEEGSKGNRERGGNKRIGRDKKG